MVMVICAECSAEFNKPPSQMRSSKGNNFCSRSCSARYNNKHKDMGINRSTIEVWLEQRITETFPGLEVHYNRKDTIGSELDIYVPSMKLAFEVNGPTHYKPIYGPDILSAKQDMDQEKRDKCQEMGIELIEIDASTIKEIKRNPQIPKIVELVLGKISARGIFRP